MMLAASDIMDTTSTGMATTRASCGIAMGTESKVVLFIVARLIWLARVDRDTRLVIRAESDQQTLASVW